MTPSFFGSAGRQLLGLHHPARGMARRSGIVLCNPAPQEQLRSHWALRKLADQLAVAGFDVLRFDYRGTGDSWGGIDGVMPEDWAEDVGLAADELRAITGVERISAIGLRLGGYLAARAAARGVPLDALVLWEPVVNGRDLIAELRARQRDQHRNLLRPPADGTDGLFGVELDAAQLDAWSRLDLAAQMPWKAQRTILVIDRESPAHQRLSGTCERHQLAAGAADAASCGRAMLGNEAIERITALLCGKP